LTLCKVFDIQIALFLPPDLPLFYMMEGGMILMY
jgi:hypothetical protein